jgi:hypothetical protein
MLTNWIKAWMLAQSIDRRPSRHQPSPCPGP